MSKPRYELNQGQKWRGDHGYRVILEVGNYTNQRDGFIMWDDNGKGRMCSTVLNFVTWIKRSNAGLVK